MLKRFTMHRTLALRELTTVALLSLMSAAAIGCSSSTGTSQSSDDKLTSLTVSAGTLSPAFAAGTSNYGVSVPNATASISVTAVTSNAYASIAMRGTAVASGAASSPFPLSVGPNLIDVVVTAQNGDIFIYDVTVTRS